MNLVSSNSAANEEEIERKEKKNSMHHVADSGNMMAETNIMKDKSYRKLKEIKRGFKS